MAWLLLLQYGVALILLIAVLAKLPDAGHFVESLRDYRFLPARSVRPVALAALVGEALVSIILLVNVFPRVGFAGAAFLFGSYAGLGRGARGSGRECGCLGRGLRLRITITTTVLNVFIAVACAAAVLIEQPEATATRTSDRIIVGSLALLVAGTYWLVLYAASVAQLIEESVVEGSAS